MALTGDLAIKIRLFRVVIDRRSLKLTTGKRDFSFDLKSSRLKLWRRMIYNGDNATTDNSPGRYCTRKRFSSMWAAVVNKQ